MTPYNPIRWKECKSVSLIHPWRRSDCIEWYDNFILSMRGVPMIVDESVFPPIIRTERLVVLNPAHERTTP